MSDLETLIATAMVICDDVVTDEHTKKKYLLGIFNNLNATNFPATHTGVVVFVQVTNGNGHYETRLDLKRQDIDKAILSLTSSIDLDSPLAVQDLNFRFDKIIIPKEGNYAFEFYCDDYLIIEKRFCAVIKTV